MTLQQLLELVHAKEVAGRLMGFERLAQADYIQRVLRDAKPRNVDAAIWIAPSRSLLNRPEIRLLILSHFRAAYSVIERMSRVLTTVALELDTLPTIVPFDPKNLRGMTLDTPFIRRIERRGQLLYRAEKV
jgi:hypothetical protein